MAGARDDLTPPLPPDARLLLAGELIGAGVAIPAGPGRPRPLEGTVVDETLGTLLVRTAPTGRTVRLEKRGLTGTLVLGAHELPLRGDLLRVRPEDRTKRLLAGGPRRIR